MKNELPEIEIPDRKEPATRLLTPASNLGCPNPINPPPVNPIDQVFEDSRVPNTPPIRYFVKVGRYLQELRRQKGPSGLKGLTSFQFVHICNIIGLTLEQYDSDYNQTSFFEACQTINVKGRGTP